MHTSTCNLLDTGKTHWSLLCLKDASSFHSEVLLLQFRCPVVSYKTFLDEDHFTAPHFWGHSGQFCPDYSITFFFIFAEISVNVFKGKQKNK